MSRIVEIFPETMVRRCTSEAGNTLAKGYSTLNRNIIKRGRPMHFADYLKVMFIPNCLGHWCSSAGQSPHGTLLTVTEYVPDSAASGASYLSERSDWSDLVIHTTRAISVFKYS